MLDDIKDKPGLLENITSDYHITKENYPMMNDFASEFGYDLNECNAVSKIGKLYRRCLSQSTRLHKLFNDQDIEKIREELEL